MKTIIFWDTVPCSYADLNFWTGAFPPSSRLKSKPSKQRVELHLVLDSCWFFALFTL
jgi:hypothetical protein